MKRRMNKQVVATALLLAVLSMGAVTGCVQVEVRKPASTTGTETQAKASSTTGTETQTKPTESQAKPTETQTEPTETSEKPTETESKVEVKGTPITLKLFSMICPDGWTVNEKMKRDQDTSAVMVIDIKNGDKSLVELEVLVEDNSASSYRKNYLKANNIDAYELVEKNTYPKTKVGGLDMVKVATDEKLLYFTRNESAGMSVQVRAKGALSDPRIEEAISTIKFTLPNDGKVDPPWEWKGERYKTDKEHTVTVADKTIKAEYIPFDKPVIPDEKSTGRVEMIGNSLWVLLDYKLYEYSMGENLTFVKEVELPEDTYQELSSDVNGNLYVSSNGAILTVKDGAVVAKNDNVHKTIMDKSGSFGISIFSNKVPEKVTISDNIASVSEWAFIEKEKVDLAGFTKNSMYVSGKNPDTKYKALWIFDKDGNPKLTLGNLKVPEAGAISALNDVIETDSGFMALDGSTRKLLFWTTDGTVIGETKDTDIFGTNFASLSSATMGDDGSIYIGLTEERADKSAEEYVVYRLSGF